MGTTPFACPSPKVTSHEIALRPDELPPVVDHVAEAVEQALPLRRLAAAERHRLDLVRKRTSP